MVSTLSAWTAGLGLVQLPHILRQILTNHFMMNGGSILVLQHTLGHTDIKVTRCYVHFALDHLNKSVTLNLTN
ncbi:tyrosine-type recombinase/integrase [Serratia marcescens]|uniref:tyrosine-type recombinase/integrase n=1 Tax=Serratia marcescens TaxID=615 RepID=UPI0002B85706|nr:integrase [Serratia marcescens VGH107]